METPLNIALTPHPTRQKFWRVVGFVAQIFAVFFLIVGVHRLCFAWSDIVPDKNETLVRIPRSPKTIAALRSVTKGITVIPGVPSSLADLVKTSRRVLTIRVAANGETAVIIDRKLSPNEILAFESFGAAITEDGNATLITSTKTQFTVHRSALSGIATTLFLHDDGQISTATASSPFSITPTSITFPNLVALHPPSIDGVITKKTLISASFTGTDLEGLTNRIFTQNTPGIADLFALATKNGISIIAEEGDTATFPISIAVPMTKETQTMVNESFLRQVAKEFTEIPTIEGVTHFLTDGSKTTTLRSREEATLVLRDETPYRFLTATTSRTSFSLTQTPDLLTIKSGIFTSTQETTPCLSQASAFIRPKKIGTLFPESIRFTPQTLVAALWSANIIASTEHQTRICYTENSSL